jgi:hypothetical protein
MQRSTFVLTRGFSMVRGLNRLLKLSARMMACNAASSSLLKVSFPVFEWDVMSRRLSQAIN